jgi:hypothetical protein
MRVVLKSGVVGRNGCAGMRGTSIHYQANAHALPSDRSSFAADRRHKNRGCDGCCQLNRYCRRWLHPVQTEKQDRGRAKQQALHHLKAGMKSHWLTLRIDVAADAAQRDPAIGKQNSGRHEECNERPEMALRQDQTFGCNQYRREDVGVLLREGPENETSERGKIPYFGPAAAIAHVEERELSAGLRKLQSPYFCGKLAGLFARKVGPGSISVASCTTGLYARRGVI